MRRLEESKSQQSIEDQEQVEEPADNLGTFINI